MSTKAALPVSEIVEQIGAIGIVPVTSFESEDDAAPTAAALIRGGINCIEITFRTSAAAAAIGRVRELDGLLVGAGTLLTAEQVRAAVDAGAQFGLAPGLNPDVVAEADRHGLPFFPGVATPSEIERATAHGSVVKLFPAAQAGGPGFIKAVGAVYPEVSFIPTGGINPSNALDYANTRGVLAVGGSWLTPADLIRQRRYDEIERLARDARKLLS
jgi:2-dehydro-3-deoxyphosphogluconate aldolase/(4S)-4-hydroxy-2-oxoglutarate aldolase